MADKQWMGSRSPLDGEPRLPRGTSVAATPPRWGRSLATAGVIIAVAASVARAEEPAAAAPAPAGAPQAAATTTGTTETERVLREQIAADLRATKAAAAQEEAVARKQFAGINFGVAIGVLVPLYRNTRIEEAVLVPSDPANPDAPKVVRATVRKSVDARLLLETHYFFQPTAYPLFGWGPVIVVQPGTDDIVEGAGLGMMVGWRREAKTSDSFNLGIALFMERRVKDLGEGITEDNPLPIGETEIRYQQKSAVSAVLLGSFSF